MKHIHSDLIHKWADGAKIEVRTDNGWKYVENPSWSEKQEYRIKPFWYNHIPCCGVLCWVQTENGSVVKRIMSSRKDGKPFVDDENRIWNNATPFTHKDILMFKVE